jgi:hypothetical protein
MNAPNLRPPGPPGGAGPAILGGRVRETGMVAAAWLATLVVAMAIAVSVPKPSVALTIAVAAGALGVVALMTDKRLEVTVTLLVLYLGLLDGPVKLLTGGHEIATVFRDVLIFAVSIGAVLRMVVKRERLTLPPLSAWVVLFVALVLAEAFNPSTHGIQKALGGFRQQLEYVPFFFFGYVLMRSKRRFRHFFLILGVLALANGVVSTYQTKMSLTQLAAWGPGYKELALGTIAPGSSGGTAARAYTSEGSARIRPPGLGKDSGFGGSVGVLALPCSLALLATWRRRRRWAPILFCLGALLGVVTGLGRLQVVGAILAVVAFLALSVSAGRRVTRPLAALLGVLALAIPLGAVLVSSEAPGTFSRYAEIAPENASSAKDKKSSELSKLPHQLAVAPFGVGLSTAGAASGFGGKVTNELEGHNVGSDTQYNFVADELGLPGLLLWVGLLITMILLAVRRLRYIEDVELRIDLAGIYAVLVAFLIIGISGPVMASAGAPYFWFAAGIAAYWFAGPKRQEPVSDAPPARAVPAPA